MSRSDEAQSRKLLEKASLCTVSRFHWCTSPPAHYAPHAVPAVSAAQTAAAAGGSLPWPARTAPWHARRKFSSAHRQVEPSERCRVDVAVAGHLAMPRYVSGLGHLHHIPLPVGEQRGDPGSRSVRSQASSSSHQRSSSRIRKGRGMSLALCLPALVTLARRALRHRIVRPTAYGGVV